jgi:hypothetical protein
MPSMVAKRDRRASEMLPSRHSLWRVRIRYALGFAAARRALMIAGLGRGKSDILRVASIWVLRANLPVRQNLGLRTQVTTVRLSLQ